MYSKQSKIFITEGNKADENVEVKCVLFTPIAVKRECGEIVYRNERAQHAVA
jgi:hypothetical protein